MQSQAEKCTKCLGMNVTKLFEFSMSTFFEESELETKGPRRLGMLFHIEMCILGMRYYRTWKRTGRTTSTKEVPAWRLDQEDEMKLLKAFNAIHGLLGWFSHLCTCSKSFPSVAT